MLPSFSLSSIFPFLSLLSKFLSLFFFQLFFFSFSFILSLVLHILLPRHFLSFFIFTSLPRLSLLPNFSNLSFALLSIISVIWSFFSSSSSSSSTAYSNTVSHSHSRFFSHAPLIPWLVSEGQYIRCEISLGHVLSDTYSNGHKRDQADFHECFRIPLKISTCGNIN